MTVVHFTMPNGRRLKFANKAACQSYFAQLAREQSRLTTGKTLKPALRDEGSHLGITGAQRTHNVAKVKPKARWRPE